MKKSRPARPMLLIGAFWRRGRTQTTLFSGHRHDGGGRRTEKSLFPGKTLLSRGWGRFNGSSVRECPERRANGGNSGFSVRQFGGVLQFRAPGLPVEPYRRSAQSMCRSGAPDGVRTGRCVVRSRSAHGPSGSAVGVRSVRPIQRAVRTVRLACDLIGPIDAGASRRFGRMRAIGRPDGPFGIPPSHNPAVARPANAARPSHCQPSGRAAPLPLVSGLTGHPTPATAPSGANTPSACSR